ncbi:MAG: hypothetical protein IK051_04595 [Rhodocyclaceae bacterium]|nr:hypothetical protein [Rhodocyclaceae bacterium]
MKYQNPEECLRAIEDLPMDQPATVQTILQDMLSTLAAVHPEAEAHLEVLEACRAPLDTVQELAALKYAELPLPPDSLQNETLLMVVSLWQLMAHSYAQVDRRAQKDDVLGSQQPLLVQRHLFYTGQAIFEYFRSHRALPPGRWAKLHQGFISAEARNIAHVRVPDPLNPVWHAQSPLEAFTAALLVDLGNPFGRSAQEFRWMCRWAQRLAPYCRLLPADADTSQSAQEAAYGLNLGTDSGLRPLAVLQQNDTLRRFEGSELANQFHAILNQFKQGVQPAALGLGDDCPQETGARLLLSLYRPWGLGSVGRRFPRRGAEGDVEMTGDWFLIGYHIDNSSLDAQQGGGHVVADDLSEGLPLDAEGFNCEHWQLINRSVSGLRLRMRPQKERLIHQQLVALRPPGFAHFLLGQISWLMFRDDGILEAGVMLLSESPRLISYRHIQVPEHGEPYVSLTYRQAFWLPKDRTSHQPETLIFQPGQCQSGDTIIVEDGSRTWRARIDRRLIIGPNFEQFSYVWQDVPETDNVSASGAATV